METNDVPRADLQVTSHAKAKELLGNLMLAFERTFSETGKYPEPSSDLVAAIRSAADLLSILTPSVKPVTKFGSRKNMLY